MDLEACSLGRKASFRNLVRATPLVAGIHKKLHVSQVLGKVFVDSSSNLGTMIQALALLALASVASASYADNLNYRSPSHHHPALGLSLRKIAARHDATDAWDPSKLNFTHGVASGDPYDTSVIIWTRVAPSSDNDKSNITVSGYVPLYDHSTAGYVKASKAPVCVEYKVASDKALKNCVDSGTVYTSSDIDYTVKLEAKNLKPFTHYC